MLERDGLRAIVRAAVVATVLVPTIAGVRGDPGPPEEPLLPFSTYFGEILSYQGTAAAVGLDGVVWVAADTSSDDFRGAQRLPPSQPGGQDVVVVRVEPAARTVLSTARMSGSGSDVVLALAIDGVGNAYMAGSTTSSEYPLASGSAPAGDVDHCPFVARLLPDGSGFAWVLRFGGSRGDWVSGLCFTADGDPVVVGTTDSPDFPVVSALNPSFSADSRDAFVTRIRSDGTGLVFSTYLVGSTTDEVACCRAPDGGLLVTATTGSDARFLSRANLAFGTAATADYESFLAEIEPSGASILRLARFRDAAKIDRVAAASGSIVLEGSSRPGWSHVAASGDSTAADSLVLLELDASTWAPIGDAQIAPPFSGLHVRGLTLDPAGTVWIGGNWTGHTFDRDFELPVPGAIRLHSAGFHEAYVASFEPANLTQTFGTYLGGTSLDYVAALATGRSGSCWVVCGTDSNDFPTVHAWESRPASASSPDSRGLFVSELREGDPSRRPAALAAPTATAIGGHSIRVGWSSDDGTSIAFGIDRAEITDWGWLTDWSHVALVPGDSREWIDNSVRADRRYRYSVQAVGPGGGSPESPRVDAATPPTLDFSITRGRAWYADAWPARAFRHGDVLDLRGTLVRPGSSDGVPDLRESGLRLAAGDPDYGTPILTIPADDEAWRVGRGGVLRWRSGRSRVVYRPSRGTLHARVTGAVPGPTLQYITDDGSGITAFRTIVGDDAGSAVPVWSFIQRQSAPHRIIGARTP